MKYQMACGTFCVFALMIAASAWSQNHPVIKRPFDLPPSADLSYLVKAKQGGFMLDGASSLKWQFADNKYSIKTETRAMILGKVHSATSEGSIDDYGLAPDIFHDKRIRRDATISTFDRNAGTVTFNTSKENYPLQGGEQDRTSIIWQLIAHARAVPKKFIAGSEWQYFVVGTSDADPWTFKVGKTEKIETPLGLLSAVRVSRVPNERGQQLEIWLAPMLDWYPVRMRQTEPDGDYIEQTLENVSKK
ncbi:MAG: DUF3108 domain-containing protein [Burkholderiales bacterium]|nr:DUF3108 domain-containing protein [Burkholderiales bacterium]